MIAFAVFFSGFFTICCLQLKQETSRGLEYMGGGGTLVGRNLSHPRGFRNCGGFLIKKNHAVGFCVHYQFADAIIRCF